MIRFFCGSLGKFANNKNRWAVKIHAHRLIGDNKIHSFLCELFLFQQYHTILGISPPILMSKGSKEGNEIMIQFLIHWKFQVPRMEVLYLISGYFRGGFPVSISRIHTAYMGEDSSILGTWNVWWLIVEFCGKNGGYLGFDWISCSGGSSMPCFRDPGQFAIKTGIWKKAVPN